MENGPDLEARVATLERDVAEIKVRLPTFDDIDSWLKSIGTISDDEAFQEAMALGREFRASDRPPDEPGESS